MKLKQNKLKVNCFEQKPLDLAHLYERAPETNVKLLETDIGPENKKKSNDSPKNVLKGKNLITDESNNNSKKNGSMDIDVLTTRNKKKVTDFSQPFVTNLLTEIKDNELKTSPSLKKKVKSNDSHIAIANDDNIDNCINLQNSEEKSKRKKRNKSISSMLDGKTIAVKKIKSNIQSNESYKTETLIKHVEPNIKTKFKKGFIGNKVNDFSNLEIDNNDDKAENKDNKPKSDMETISDVDNETAIIGKKSRRKSKKPKDNEVSISGENQEFEKKSYQNIKRKKGEKMRHHIQLNKDLNKADGESVIKSHKKDKPGTIAEDLHDLKIGGNMHNLTTPIDKICVNDQKKRNGNGTKKKIDKQSKVENTEKEFVHTSKEKEKWNKRKWNKDVKGKCHKKKLTPVVVENLPFNIILNYKKLLIEHFMKFGVVKRVGIAQVYSTEDPKPVFTTTVYLDSEDSASKALQDDNTCFEGNVIRVKKTFPTTQTIAVVRSYCKLNDQIISSVFSEAGRIRNIRHIVKGKKSKATAFVEFDVPEAVKRAVKIAEETRIGGKNINVSKYRLKPKKDLTKKKHFTMTENQTESDGSNY